MQTQLENPIIMHVGNGAVQNCNFNICAHATYITIMRVLFGSENILAFPHKFKGLFDG